MTVTSNSLDIARYPAISNYLLYCLKSSSCCKDGGLFDGYGKTAYYASLPLLMSDLKKAHEQNRLDRRWRVYLRPDILVVDEVGYMQLNRQEAELFFRLICSRYEHGSIILTSNKNFSEWGEMLGVAVIATAILDRLLHHAHVVSIRGNTYRLKDRLKAGVILSPPAEVPAVN